MRRVRVLIAGLIAGPALALIPMLSVHADIPANVASYESHVYGSGVHVVGYTDAYPNFSTGAVDNHYPLAKARQDGSPLSDAVATYSDVGPAVLTVAACSKPDPSQCPPNPGAVYANAHYPGGPPTGHVDSCTPSSAASSQAAPCPAKNQPASYADTAAGELMADASGYYAGGGSQPFSGAAAHSRTEVRPDGSLVVISHSSVHDATFGTVHISKVDVTVTVVSARGSATADAVVSVGGVTVAGQPVTVTDQGTTVQQQQVVPCPGGTGAGAGAGLPAPGGAPGLPVSGPPQTNGSCVPQVQTETIRVYTVAPQKTVTGNHGTVSASGLHVAITQPSAPGTPTQRVEYVLGEGYADGVLSPQQAAAGGPPLSDSGGDGAGGDAGGGGGADAAGSAGSAGGDYGDGGSDMSAAGPDMGAGGSDAAPVAAVNPAALFVAANRRPLVYMFLLWESLIMASAAAWVWTRRMRARTLAAEAAA